MTVIADTGALYALVDKSDAWHTRVVTWWSESTSAVTVPVTVLPEVAYLLQTRIGVEAEQAFIQSVANGEFALEQVEAEDMSRAADVMSEYSDFPLGFVDASIVALAERFDARELLTTDRRHFGVVRPRHARRFTLLP
ncbi:MAG: PIN domain-containing protein [Gemmatimonadota bacterium]